MLKTPLARKPLEVIPIEQTFRLAWKSHITSSPLDGPLTGGLGRVIECLPTDWAVATHEAAEPLHGLAKLPPASEGNAESSICCG